MEKQANNKNWRDVIVKTIKLKNGGQLTFGEKVIVVKSQNPKNQQNQQNQQRREQKQFDIAYPLGSNYPSFWSSLATHEKRQFVIKMKKLIANPLKVVDVHQWLQKFAYPQNQPDELRVVGIRNKNGNEYVCSVMFSFKENTTAMMGLGVAFLVNGKVAHKKLNTSNTLEDQQWLKRNVERKSNIPILVDDSFPFF